MLPVAPPCPARNIPHPVLPGMLPVAPPCPARNTSLLPHPGLQWMLLVTPPCPEHCLLPHPNPVLPGTQSVAPPCPARNTVCCPVLSYQEHSLLPRPVLPGTQSVASPCPKRFIHDCCADKAVTQWNLERAPQPAPYGVLGWGWLPHPRFCKCRETGPVQEPHQQVGIRVYAGKLLHSEKLTQLWRNLWVLGLGNINSSVNSCIRLKKKIFVMLLMSVCFSSPPPPPTPFFLTPLIFCAFFICTWVFCKHAAAYYVTDGLFGFAFIRLLLFFDWNVMIVKKCCRFFCSECRLSLCVFFTSFFLHKYTLCWCKLC